MADTANKTISEFIAANQITMACERTDANPNMSESRDMDHWKCLIQRYGQRRRNHGKPGSTTGKSRMTLTFSQGYGHKGAEPKLADVLDCLASDAAGAENAQDFEEWCSEYGYDPDSRKAEKTYNTVEHQAARLKTFLGDDLYNELLWNTERE
jgi:hypothetical protein